MVKMEFSPKLTDRQTEAWMALNEPLALMDVLFGGAKGGGKSYFLCVWCFLWLTAIASRFELKPSDNPPHVGWMGRKVATDFTATTLQTWYQNIPADRYVVKGATEKYPKHILIDGRIALDFGGLDRQVSINKFNSAQYAIIAVDQAEETTENDVSVLKATRRLTIDGRPLKYKGLWTANPKECWLKRDFIDRKHPSRKFIQSLPADNPHLPQSYIEILKDSFSYRPELLEAYLNGRWDELEANDQVIKSKWLDAARLIRLHGDIKRLLVCDPARFGDDETVNYELENTRIVDKDIYGQKDTMYTANKLASKSRAKGDCPVVIDVIGIGAGIADRLRELEVPVIEINSSAKARQPERYFNVRSEMWDNAAVLFSESDISWSGMDIDPELERELLSPTYKFRKGKILIEKKEDIKKRLGKSPNRADAYIMGLYGLKFVSPEKESKSKKLTAVGLPSHIRNAAVI